MKIPMEYNLKRIIANIAKLPIASLGHVIEFDKEQMIAYNVAKNKFKNGYPLDYILGELEILGLKLTLNEDVIIPRPETEDWLVDICSELDTSSKLLDLGCGSGLIGLYLASKLPNEVILSDVSKAAIRVAKINASVNKLDSKVTFYVCDLLQNTDLIYQLGQNWILIANLPYVPIIDKLNAKQNMIEFEPSLAIYSGDDGLDAFRTLINQIQKLEFKPKKAYFELDPRNIKDAFKYSKHVFLKQQIVLDKTQMERLLVCEL